MKKHIFPLLVLALAALACNLTPAPTGVPPMTDPPTASNTPEYTLVAFNTLEPTLTFTPSVPMVTVSVDTNCLKGPGTDDDIVGVLHVGETAEVVGKAPYGGSWIIKNPDGEGTCWLWYRYATVVGNTAGLPTIDITPTPTLWARSDSLMNFSVSYENVVNCWGSYGIRFKFINTGTVTWESFRMEIIDWDWVTSTPMTLEFDEWRDLSAPDCVFFNTKQALAHDEIGRAGNWVAMTIHSPIGHFISATFTLCTLDGMAGDCITRSIAFTP